MYTFCKIHHDFHISFWHLGDSNTYNLKNTQLIGHWWLMPVILATQEAEIRSIRGPSQPGQIVCETLSPKYPIQKRAGKVAQVVECLPSKHTHTKSERAG
jgi:hypothetical protein